MLQRGVTAANERGTMLIKRKVGGRGGRDGLLGDGEGREERERRSQREVGNGEVMNEASEEAAGAGWSTQQPWKKRLRED